MTFDIMACWISCRIHRRTAIRVVHNAICNGAAERPVCFSWPPRSEGPLRKRMYFIVRSRYELQKPTLAIDMPLKMLVWEDKDGNTFATYNTGAHVCGTTFARHGRKQPRIAARRLEKILDELANAAAK